uniref:ATP synthase complex subunit 8 n=1 Tax=Phyllomedusa tomopterna TaxID=248868 RepID=S4V2A9_PHYTM|nr:ATP synthase F0 subunit 8 [Phyllomedusa tomopterna]
MPQLDPSPWFYILLLSWTFIILLSPIKLSKFIHLNNPAVESHKNTTKTWFWPWP